MTTKTHATPSELKNIAHTTGALSYCRRYVASKNLRSERSEVTCEKCLSEMPEAVVSTSKIRDASTDRRLAANKHLPSRTKSERAAARKAARAPVAAAPVASVAKKQRFWVTR